MSIVTEPTQSYSTQDFKKDLEAHVILLYMKGTPEKPLCGFSQLVVNILKQYEVPFKAIDVLFPDIRSSLKQHSRWPTFPQLYIKGELVGGSDIVEKLHANGALEEKLLSALPR